MQRMLSTNQGRAGPRDQQRQLKRGLRSLKREGFRQIHVLDSPEAVESVTLERAPLWNNEKQSTDRSI